MATIDLDENARKKGSAELLVLAQLEGRLAAAEALLRGGNGFGTGFDKFSAIAAIKMIDARADPGVAAAQSSV